MASKSSNDVKRLTRRRFIAAAASAGLTYGGGDLMVIAATTVDDPLLVALDLTQPDIATVKSAMDAGDTAGARTAFAAHLRSRTAPKWYFDPADPPKNADEADMARANDALSHTFNSVGIPHTFGPKIDWAYNPTTQPGSPNAPDNEWTWQMSRHAEWLALSRAFTTTGDVRYGHELALQVADWITANPTPTKVEQGPGSRWRTIECGIRMGRVWPEVYFRMVRRPDVFPDAVLLAMVDCIRRHGDYLDAHPTGGNWLFMEANGEFHVGVLFPEFQRAAHWRDTGMGRLEHELAAQIYPDGVQHELTPGYHNVTIDNSVWALALARLNDVPVPEGYLGPLEKMYATDLLAMSPDRDVPAFNDSWHVDVPGRMRDALKYYPARDDFQWIATDGAAGTKPTGTSHLFPYAGWSIMRSTWDRDAHFLMFDGGPFGSGHQHEDKLSFVLHAHGRRMIFDAGSYAYDASPMRAYVTSPRGHKIISVDGLGQHRAGANGRYYVTKAPVPLVWRCNADFDYAQASFGDEPVDNWGPKRLHNVLHTRRILFVKSPGYWVIVDSLTPNDTDPHTYESIFHIDAPTATIDTAAKSVSTTDKGQPNLLILPLASPGLDVRIVEGQMEPTVQGWLPIEHGRTGANPRPVASYTTAPAAGPVHLVYAFAPAADGQPFPVKAVSATPTQNGDQLAANIVQTDGVTRSLTINSQGNLSFQNGSGAPNFSSGAEHT